MSSGSFLTFLDLLPMCRRGPSSRELDCSVKLHTCVAMADAKRDVTAKHSPAAMRGRISERAWVDIRRAARIASTAGVTLRVHGVEVSGTALMQRRMRTKMQGTNVQSKVPAASVAAPATHMETSGEAPTPPLSKRQQRSKARLLEFQEKKREALVQKCVAYGTDLVYAHEKVQRLERRRLERIAAKKRRETRMDVDAASVEQPCARVAEGGERPWFCMGLAGRPCQCVGASPSAASAPDAG